MPHLQSDPSSHYKGTATPPVYPSGTDPLSTQCRRENSSVKRRGGCSTYQKRLVSVSHFQAQHSLALLSSLSSSSNGSLSIASTTELPLNFLPLPASFP
ncbi:hypothetical protein XELAEV_18040543mg, partial [Xenopus laevis]